MNLEIKMNGIWNIILSIWWYISYWTYDSAVKSTESRPTSTGANSRQAEKLTTGKYELLKTIGKGKYAKVMLAKHEPTGKEVAIKIINKTQLSRGSLRKLYREEEIMRMLDHPNIAKLFHVIETEKTLYLIMEYASGGDMYNYLARHGTMKEDDARAKFRQIVSAVQYCHRKGVVHRDLKAENILLDGDNNIKIADFGLSTKFTAEDKLDTFCGTLRYAAPEVFLDIKYDGPKVDVWALGIMLYKMVSNAFPFTGSTFPKLREQVVHGEYEIPSCISPACVGLLKKLLVLDPIKRASLDTITKDKWMNHCDENDGIGNCQ